MIFIDKLSQTPVYEQIIEGIERNILLGIYAEGTQLPSLRELSVMIGINPNTVQKSYAELTRRGIIQPSPGSGCYVAPSARELLRIEARQKLARLSALVGELSLSGLSREEILAAVNDTIDGQQTLHKEENA
jgi:GntR family transcriptional regulator